MATNIDLELGKVNVIGETVQLLLACERKVHDRDDEPSIFKVPRILRDFSPSSYYPGIVSIGPVHRNARKVQAMEEQKATYLHNLLACLKLPAKQTLEACVEKVTASIYKIRESYSELGCYDDVQLAQMMVMDGIFILEFVYNFQKHFSEVLIARSIISDLLLIENQIPLFVLQDLFECTILKSEHHEPDVSLITRILKVRQLVPLFEEKLREDNVLRGTTPPSHILGLLHRCIQPEKSFPAKSTHLKVKSVVELDMAGVKFKPIQDPSWPMAIQVESSKYGCFFWNWGKPTLRMPAMRIHDLTESIIRNLIVYEQISSQVPTYITSYAAAIDDLVDTEEDIAILVESGVIINSLNSKQEAANIINNICKEIMCVDYTEQWENLDGYYNGYMAKTIFITLTQLWRTYFTSPWNFIALIAGIVLFALTIVQTIFTIKSA